MKGKQMGGFLSGVRKRLINKGFNGDSLEQIMKSVAGTKNRNVPIPRKVISRLSKLLQTENAVVVVVSRKGLFLYPFQTYQDMKIRGTKLNMLPDPISDGINIPINPKANLGCRYNGPIKKIKWEESELKTLPEVFRKYVNGEIDKNTLTGSYQERSLKSIKMAVARHILHTVK